MRVLKSTGMSLGLTRSSTGPLWQSHSPSGSRCARAPLAVFANFLVLSKWSSTASLWAAIMPRCWLSNVNRSRYKPPGNRLSIMLPLWFPLAALALLAVAASAFPWSELCFVGLGNIGTGTFNQRLVVTAASEFQNIHPAW